MEVGSDASDDDSVQHLRQQQRRRIEDLAVDRRIENPDAVMEPCEEAWLERDVPLTLDNLKLNCTPSAVFRSMNQILPQPQVDSDTDDSDDEDQVAVTLSNVNQVANLGTNYANQEYTHLIGIITNVKMTNNVQITSYSRGGNQQNRRGNQQMLGNQRMTTLLDPNCGAGTNIFVVIEQRNGMVFSNDLSAVTKAKFVSDSYITLPIFTNKLVYPSHPSIHLSQALVRLY